jgi:hypothetical protein
MARDTSKACEFHQWLETFPEDQVRDELRALEAEAGRLEQEIRVRRRLLEIREQVLGLTERGNGQVELRMGDSAWVDFRDDAAHSGRAYVPGRLIKDAAKVIERAATPERASPPQPDEEGVVRPATEKLSRADKLMYFLSRHRGEAWKLSDIRDQLVSDGILGDSEAETHGLQVTASRLARTQKLERPAPGVYRLAPIPVDEAAEG